MTSNLKNYIKVLGNRNLLKLWLAHAISTFGDWLIFIVLIQRIYKLSESNFAVGSLMIFKVLPALFLGSIAGVIIDRYDRKKIMIICDLIRGAIVVTLPFFHIIAPIYIFVFLLEGFSILFFPAREASIPNIVDNEQIIVSNSLFYLTNNIMMFLSFTFGSTIVFVIERIFINAPTLRVLAGQNIVFYIDSFTFFISAVLTFFTFIPSVNTKTKKSDTPKITFTMALIEGGKYLKSNVLVRVMIISSALQIFGAGSVCAVGTAYCEYALGVGSESMGFLLSSYGLGMIIGSVFLGIIEHYFKKIRLFSFAVFITGMGLVLFSINSNIQCALIIALFSGVASSVSIIVLITCIQSYTEEEIRGRVLTIFEITFRVSLLFSLIFGGLLSDILGKERLVIFTKVIPFHSSQVILFIGGLICVFASVFSFIKFKLYCDGSY